MIFIEHLKKNKEININISGAIIAPESVFNLFVMKNNMNIEGFNCLKEDNPVEADNKYNFDYMIYNNNEKFEKK